MMPGVAAQPLGGRSVFSPTVLADADYINEVYELAGSPVAAASIIDKPARIGVSGLEILNDDVDGVVAAIADYLALLLTLDWTVVIEWDELTTDGATYLLYLADVDDNHTFRIERSTAFTGLRVDAHEASFNTRNVEINTSHGPGVHKIAVTRTNDFLSISCDGSAVVTQVVAPISMNPMATASFGGDPTDQSYNGTFIRKVTLYAPLADIWLPALSA
ncbi:hypothetical protein X740_04430 [Mesorhizobium sp. LNHC221B00]|uniref:hypothetical protein n=1 Tax=Mesorhizobium sp. LNHC221B00 TaxID=1287233 RepID=UPI0003CE2334|nr:hypothetical protein [Mesorhizobium sp. LNHC221B00]ESY82449.1 hypothetical protein X740_04430 [Mesorhizobium sp. LNHC221B00]